MAPLFNALVGGESQCQILCSLVEPLRGYGRFRFFKMAAVHHLGFSKVGNFNCPYPLGGQMRHHAKFCADRSGRCGYMAVFDFSRWRPSAILDFQKLEILTARTLRGAKMRHRAEFCADQSRRCGDMAVFDFLRWRPSAILDLLYACLDHPRSVLWCSLSLCKIWYESVQ